MRRKRNYPSSRAQSAPTRRSQTFATFTKATWIRRISRLRWRTSWVCNASFLLANRGDAIMDDMGLDYDVTARQEAHREAEEKERLRYEKTRKERERKDREHELAAMEEAAREIEKIKDAEKERREMEAERIAMEENEKDRKAREAAEKEKQKVQAKLLEKTRELERKEREKKEVENRDRERIDLERREQERRELEKLEREMWKKERQESLRRDAERRELERRERDRVEQEKKELDRMERERTESRELERKEIERRALAEREAKRKDMQSIFLGPPSSQPSPSKAQPPIPQPSPVPRMAVSGPNSASTPSEAQPAPLSHSAQQPFPPLPLPGSKPQINRSPARLIEPFVLTGSDMSASPRVSPARASTNPFAVRDGQMGAPQTQNSPSPVDPALSLTSSNGAKSPVTTRRVVPQSPPPMISVPSVTYVIARFAYSPTTDRELLLKVGDKIEVLEERGEWTLGRNAEKTVGYFPTSFVDLVFIY